jgi:hypothetical protein
MSNISESIASSHSALQVDNDLAIVKLKGAGVSELELEVRDADEARLVGEE